MVKDANSYRFQRIFRYMLISILVAIPAVYAAAAPGNGLLFHLSGEKGFDADYSAGDGKAAFRTDIEIIPDGAAGSGFRCADFTPMTAVVSLPIPLHTRRQECSVRVSAGPSVREITLLNNSAPLVLSREVSSGGLRKKLKFQ
jgi:hypothetical protein